jgi:hypothetical protein
MNFGLSNDYQTFRNFFEELGLWVTFGLLLVGIAYIVDLLILSLM